jgi:hypothetical protein
MIKYPKDISHSYRKSIDTHINNSNYSAREAIYDDNTLKQLLDFTDILLFLFDRVSCCHFGCQNDNHIYEQLLSKFCNNSNALIYLARSGLNDQSYSCYRSMAEIVNLISLFWHSEDDFDAFCKSNKKERLKLFRPTNVREKLEKLGSLSIISKEEYSRISGIGIHPDKDTRSNQHNPSGLSYSRPEFQIFSFIHLNYCNAYLCSALSLIISDLKHIPKEAKDLFQNTSKELNNKLIPQIMKKLEEMSNN